MLGGVVLDQLSEVRAVAEALSDRLDVRAEAVCRDLWPVDDPLPHIVDEQACRGLGTLTRDVGNDRLARRTECDKRVLIALICLAKPGAALRAVSN